MTSASSLPDRLAGPEGLSIVGIQHFGHERLEAALAAALLKPPSKDGRENPSGYVASMLSRGVSHPNVKTIPAALKALRARGDELPSWASGVLAELWAGTPTPGQETSARSRARIEAERAQETPEKRAWREARRAKYAATAAGVRA